VVSDFSSLSRSVLFNFSAHSGFSLAKAFTDYEKPEENEQKQEKWNDLCKPLS